MKIKHLSALIIVIGIFTQAQLFAQSSTKAKDGWVLLGTRAVDYLIDHDEVDLTGKYSNLKSLKFTIRNGTLNMHKCTIHFEDGETTNLDFTEENKGPFAERIVDLKGSHRAIEKVTFWYDTKSSSDNKATLEIWGKV